jgi:SAM-dependent methyltransferase
MRSSLKAVASAVAQAVTSGKSQNFLGARWVSGSLGAVPKKWRRPLALRFLAVSPHYFYRNSTNAALRKSKFLESEYARNLSSRKLIFDGIVSKYLEPHFNCLDYGCGPGFLARAVAPEVTKVVACDISSGVLACARAINSGNNIEYRKIAADGTIPVQNEAVDLVYSFAVIQHVTNDVLSKILIEFKRALKPGGKVVCHVVFDQEGWKSETEWQADKTIKGRLKWRYGLRCFSRSLNSFESMVTGAGFRLVQTRPISELGVDLAGDDIARQHLSIFQR